MKIFFDRKYLTVALVLTMGIAALTALSLQTLTQWRSDLVDFDQAQEVQAKTQRIYTFLWDLQAGQRDYLRTREGGPYLERYRAGLMRLDAELSDLSALTQSHSDQADKLQKLRGLVAAKRAELVQMIALAQTQDSGPARVAQHLAQDNALLDSIRAVLDPMDPMARTAQRHAAHMAGIERSAGHLALLAAALNLLLAALVVLVWRDRALRERLAGTQAAAWQAEEQRMLERTGQLEAASRSLALSEARLQGIFDSATDAMLTTDAQQRIVSANPSAARLFRCERRDLVGASLDRLIPVRFHAAHRSYVQAFGANEQHPRRMGGSREVMGLRADGEEFPIDASISHLQVDGLRLYTVILRDITRRRKDEAALRESKAKLEAALASMNDSVLITDAEGRCVEFNDAFVSFHRFGRREECSQTPAEYAQVLEVLLHDGTPAPLSQWAALRALNGETASNVEHVLRRKDTGETWVGSYSFAPIRSREGDIVGSVVTARDISKIKKAQADLADSHAQLQLLIGAQHRIQEDERRRIARELHDDLQQSLAAIRMDTVAIGERIASGREGAQALLLRIDKLAAAAIASTRRIVSDLRPEMLEELGLVPALEVLTQQFAERTDSTCTLACAADATEDLASRPTLCTCLFRVVQESLNNVAKHAGASEVGVRLCRRDDLAVLLTVTDNGCGMAADAPRKLKSFGLQGMAERVRAMGGVLRVESRLGSGTTIEVSVPIDAPMKDGLY